MSHDRMNINMVKEIDKSGRKKKLQLIFDNQK
jgi:hypothetical protein